MDSDLRYKIAFSWLRGMNVTLGREILGRVGSEEQFFGMTDAQLSALLGFKSRILERSHRDTVLSRAERECDFLAASSVKAVYFTSDDYPQRLLQAEDAPAMLFTLGHADLNAGHFLAVVGTRHATPYGSSFVRRIIEDCSRMLADPLTVVSGLAFGIDAESHTASLKYGVTTAGVLAHGLNTIYPSAHRSLASDIVRAGGALVTEYGSDAPIHKGNFLARNRIVAGLCDALVVAESAKRGGALVTARLATGYNRDVFALPGRTSDVYSQGCNQLIASHTAGLISDASDLIDAMGWRRKTDKGPEPTLFPNLTPEEESVCEVLRTDGEAHISVISARTGVTVSRLMAMLIDMEFRNLVLSYPGGKYRLA